MIASLWQRLVQLSRRLWVRVLMIAGIGILAVPLAAVLSPLIPEWLGERIGAAAVGPILQVLASSMLTVTTFSLTLMSGAFRTAWSQWSPRTHVILKDDVVTQSVLATFVGAFLFALTAIVLRATDFFGARETVVLFALTVGVIALIVLSMIRWIAHLEQLGSLSETGAQVQLRAERAMRAIGQAPCRGARPLGGPGTPDLTRMYPLRADRAGYVQQVMIDLMQERAAAREAQVCVLMPAGAYVNPGTELARLSDDADELMRGVAGCFMIAGERSFVQDPGFGVNVLAEIGCRALSPGINDPETAIGMVRRLSTVLLLADREAEVPDPWLDRVWLPAPDLDAFFHDSFDRLARDAGPLIEVQLAIQRSLDEVARLGHGDLRTAAQACRARSAARARRALQGDPDLARFERGAPQPEAAQPSSVKARSP